MADCRHLDEWKEEGEFTLCSDCGMEMDPVLDHNDVVDYYKAHVEQVEMDRETWVMTARKLGGDVVDLKDRITGFEEGHKDFNRAINFALNRNHVGDYGILFLHMWREGAWDEIDREFPEWKRAKDQNP